MEVDPFEARLEFLGLLGKLNASQHSIQKVGNFAMRNRNLYEDLYSCIIEELEQTSSINARMNIFYVLDSICHQSHKAGFPGYTELIQRNLTKIIDCVTPSGPKGNVNVAGTKKILETWRNKKLFPGSVIDTVEEPLLSRELGANAPMTTETGFTKDDILKRMDEDRERHKRIREEIWIRPSDEDPGAEFEQYWDEVADIEDVDYEDMEGENDKYLPGYPWTLEFDRFLPSPAIFKSKASTPSQPSALPSPTTPAIASHLSADGQTSPMDYDSVVGVKRLTSPAGTVSVAGPTVHAITPLSKPAQQGPASSVISSTSDSYHNGYHPPPPPPARRSDHAHPHPPSSRSHYPHQTSQPSHSQHSYHAPPHSHSYYEPAIPTGPAADTAAVTSPHHHHHHHHHHPSASSVSSASRSSSVPRRSSPPPTLSSSSYHPYGHSRPYYHERTSSSSSAHSGYANGRAADHAP